MTEPPPNVLELPLEVRAEMAFKEAVENVIDESIREGFPFYIWRDGRVVDLLKELRAKRARQE